MQKTDKVVVVTVTYNSNHFLTRCLNSLFAQSYEIEKIIVVDNHSNEENKVKNEELVNDKIELIYLNDNTGGAGGFEHGMKAALKYSPDWVWLMDDDAFPTVNCLELLLKHKNYDNIGCLCPAIFGVDFQKYQTYHHKKVSSILFKETAVIEDYNLFPDTIEIDANAFVGPLVSIKAINEIGVAEGGLFIYGDDTEYTYRLTRKFKMLVVKEAIINHRDVVAPSDTINPKVWWKDYYMYRNRFLFIDKYGKNWFSKFLAKLSLKFNIRLRILSTRLKKKFKGYRKIRIGIFKKAIKDGKNKVYGKTIDPGQYIASLPKKD